MRSIDYSSMMVLMPAVFTDFVRRFPTLKARMVEAHQKAEEEKIRASIRAEEEEVDSTGGRSQASAEPPRRDARKSLEAGSFDHPKHASRRCSAGPNRPFGTCSCRGSTASSTADMLPACE